MNAIKNAIENEFECAEHYSDYRIRRTAYNALRGIL